MNRKKTLRNDLIAYSFIGVWIFGFAVFMAFPLVASLVFSLSNVSVLGTGLEVKPSGFKNFIAIFEIEDGFVFLEKLADFLVELLFRLPIIIVFSIIIAVLLNRKFRGRALFRSIFFLPVIISSGPVINELISQGAGGTNIINSYGFISIIEESLNPTLAKPLVALFSEIIIVFWFSGVQILIILAGLQKIDRSIYEAASVDGAGPWEKFWKITLPALSNLIFVNIIYTVVLLATFSENEVIQHIRGSMNKIDQNYSYYGIASAMAWIYFIVILAVLGILALLFMPRERKRRKRFGQ
ncbi:MAG: sugar ABC transporter permease [Bacilli bacterium]|jgi:ABC-type sugar transport system permease subunit|nr:sugar ABC transporter permease [Acholeplasmataceae bacterium]HOA78466.1 sugar ABC transporter permease [Bacilli bacterium]HPZ27038.1 sugar ABC transporter permease [Bacilli bacterium]HQC89625.1 sugar ABC transporter permease [Bacilli bacterium]